jgi:HSP20 family protein
VTFGFSFKLGLGGSQFKAGSRRELVEDATESSIQEVRQPQADVMEEEDYTLVVAEMPGIAVRDVRLEIQEDLLSIFAARGDKKYCLEVLLPRSYSREMISLSLNNGVLEIRCRG